MNKITLSGLIRNIRYSHNIKDVEYYKAELLVERENGLEDLLNLKFKRFSCPYKENDKISLTGNIRTFSRKLDNDKSKVDIYVFTYFDIPEVTANNIVELDGKICKKGDLRKTRNGKDVIDFIIANNISNDTSSLNCYLPVVAWGKQAKQISKLPVGSIINIKGELRSREYKKQLDNGNFEIRIAHEVVVKEIL